MSFNNMQLPESMSHLPVSECSTTNPETVEVSGLNSGTDRESVWWELSPEELSSHVRRNTWLAQWLERNFGWRRLLRACAGMEAIGPNNAKLTHR
jgi:hypothetical protein